MSLSKYGEERSEFDIHHEIIIIYQNVKKKNEGKMKSNFVTELKNKL